MSGMIASTKNSSGGYKKPRTRSPAALTLNSRQEAYMYKYLSLSLSDRIRGCAGTTKAELLELWSPHRVEGIE